MGEGSQVLTTRRCVLSKIADTDFSDVQGLYEDDEVRRYLGGSVEQAQFIARFSDMLSTTGGVCYWVVREKESSNFIGLVSLDQYHDAINKEVSYQFAPSYWGRGYATEVIERVIEHALQELKLPRLVAETQTANERSCRLLTRVGMKLETTVVRFGAEQSVFSISEEAFSLHNALVRDAQERDYPAIVQLNDSEVQHTSPMDLDRLHHLAMLSSYLRVAVVNDEAVAFLLAMQAGAPYHNENFSWFSSRYESFLYIDRVVVKRDFQGRGIGKLLYHDVFAFAAREHIPLLVCEINTVPPNETSVAFHLRHGFSEVGSQWLDEGKKKVSMQVAGLAMLATTLH